MHVVPVWMCPWREKKKEKVWLNSNTRKFLKPKKCLWGTIHLNMPWRHELVSVMSLFLLSLISMLASLVMVDSNRERERWWSTGQGARCWYFCGWVTWKQVRKTLVSDLNYYWEMEKVKKSLFSWKVFPHDTLADKGNGMEGPEEHLTRGNLREVLTFLFKLSVSGLKCHRKRDLSTLETFFA